ncbi:hypothetical protein [Nereida sp. MMG025]|uniref:hypothetical protein n=1 Tax=Nereida sp. MMG025 TaxID=2909981 RepID=UPI001F1B9067|nr:hypothetical protein [Nereida sp. MMG025]MCF6445506.1 hypothetical protein [Nereida sp. MMG025]
MRRVLLCCIGVFGLAACQVSTVSNQAPAQPVPQPETITSGPSDARRAQINRCLAEAGKPPVPDTIDGLRSPMNAQETEIFTACMRRTA